MKKLLLCTLLFGASITNAFASDPLKLEITSGNEGIKYLKFTSKEDSIVINDFKLNRGNCSTKIITTESEKAKLKKANEEYEKLKNDYEKAREKYIEGGYSDKDQKVKDDAYDRYMKADSKRIRLLGDIFPKTLKFGEDYTYTIFPFGKYQCDNLMEVRANTNKGELVYTFE